MGETPFADAEPHGAANDRFSSERVACFLKRLSREGTLTRRRTWQEGRQLLEGGACEGHSTAIRRSPLVTRRAAQRSAGLGPLSRARGIRQATRQTSDGWREKRCFGRHSPADKQSRRNS